MSIWMNRIVCVCIQLQHWDVKESICVVLFGFLWIEYCKKQKNFRYVLSYNISYYIQNISKYCTLYDTSKFEGICQFPGQRGNLNQKSENAFIKSGQ